MGAGQDPGTPCSPSDQLYSSANKTQDIHQWASRYKEMQRKNARSKNKEMAMLSAPSIWQGNDEEEAEEMELFWEEEEIEEEEEKFQ